VRHDEAPPIFQQRLVLGGGGDRVVIGGAVATQLDVNRGLWYVDVVRQPFSNDHVGVGGREGSEMEFVLSALEIVLGAVLAILTTVYLENLRKPKLDLAVAEAHDVDYTIGPRRPANVARYLAVDVVNTPLPRWARWWSRDAAVACHGSISFHHLDGHNVFGRSMSARWSGAPEPVFVQYRLGQGPVVVVDPSRVAVGSRMDLYAGERQRLDVAARFDNDAECYGWNNESYFSNPQWRNPDWVLPRGRYFVRITVRSAAQSCTSFFRLINGVSRQDSGLEPALPSDCPAD